MLANSKAIDDLTNVEVKTGLWLSEHVTSDQLETVYNDPYIQAIGDDDYLFEPVDHPLVRYYGAMAADVFCGVFMVIRFSRYEVEIHSLLFKRYVHCSRQFGQMIIKRCFEIPEILRLTAWVFADLKTAANYVKKLGFVYEGTKRNAVEKGGKPCDSVLFGLTRERFEGLDYVKCG